MAPVVGFDLDLTLIDSRPQILSSHAATADELGVAIDPDAVDARMGLKLEDELAFWFPPERITEAAAVYRRHYLVAAAQTEALPGAREALEAVREAGGRTAILTAKHASTVGACLRAAGLHADEVVSFVHGPEKAVELRRLAAVAYVGDSPPDMAAAVAAGAVGVGVTTGSFDADALRAAGASLVLPDLRSFSVGALLQS